MTTGLEFVLAGIASTLLVWVIRQTLSLPLRQQLIAARRLRRR
jgi:hypothetical protein